MRKIIIPKAELYKLYHLENKSTYKIAKIYKCTSCTISNKLKEFNISLKSQSQARMRYPKYNFNGDLTEGSYLIGFRLGDLRVYKTVPHAETIIVQCHTTVDEQVFLFKKLFRKYGYVSVMPQKDKTININCYLNNTFSFLLPKEDSIESWIYKKEEYFLSFMAGYIDAEGSFGINQGRGRFKMDSYDKNILYQIHLWLTDRKINSKFLLVGRKGVLRPGGYVFNNDLWRLNVNKAGCLFKFINMLEPFIKHKKRIRDMIKVLNNIKIRQNNGTISIL